MQRQASFSIKLFNLREQARQRPQPVSPQSVRVTLLEPSRVTIAVLPIEVKQQIADQLSWQCYRSLSCTSRLHFDQLWQQANMKIKALRARRKDTMENSLRDGLSKKKMLFTTRLPAWAKRLFAHTQIGNCWARYTENHCIRYTELGKTASPSTRSGCMSLSGPVHRSFAP